MPSKGEQPHPYISSADIAAMPQDRYDGLVGFLRAAPHELGHVIAKLLGIGGQGQ